MARKIGVHAIVRFRPMPSGDPLASFYVKEVLPSEEEAIAEVDRLNSLADHDEETLYFSVYTRFYPDGRRVKDEI